MTTKIPQFTKPAYSVRLLAALATSASRSRAVAIAHNASVGDRGSGER